LDAKTITVDGEKSMEKMKKGKNWMEVFDRRKILMD